MSAIDADAWARARAGRMRTTLRRRPRGRRIILALDVLRGRNGVLEVTRGLEDGAVEVRRFLALELN